MEQTGIKEKVIHEICSLAQKYDITEVILFGSRARGDYGQADQEALDNEFIISGITETRAIRAETQLSRQKGASHGI